MYVIRHNSKGLYVALPGRRKSYTDRLQYAQQFSTFDQAKSNACGNEIVLPLRDFHHGIIKTCAG